MSELILFFELISVAVGEREHLSKVPSSQEWRYIFEMAKKQSLVGICFAGIQRLGANSAGGFLSIGIGEVHYLTWLGLTADIQQKNESVNLNVKIVLSHFRNQGLACQVLKGQGVAKLYGDLCSFRQPGDIDIWSNGGLYRVAELSKKRFGQIQGLTYYHIHYPFFDDVSVELHFKPSFLSSPVRNKKFVEFAKKYEPRLGCTDEPSLTFNRVYILLHCYRHLCGHGVGMRQLMDYYFVLKQGFSKEEKVEAMYWISRLGMSKFVGAMMWVMQNVFGLSEKNLLCVPNPVGGQFLLNEVIHSGNMGHGEDRFDGMVSARAISRYWYNIKRDFRLLQICPHEALWDPFFNVYQFMWCKLQKKRAL